MKAFTYATLIVHFSIPLEAVSQHEKKSNTAAVMQFAGSTGSVTTGLFKSYRNELFQLGLQYGYTPQKENDLHSVSLKALYNPYTVSISRKLEFHPLQTGVFVSQNFGRTLPILWSDHYPKHYYWWPPSLRSHFFLGTAASVKPQSGVFSKISLYFEANTNDLYLASFLDNKNHKTLTLYDIFFFGTGVKAWF